MNSEPEMTPNDACRMHALTQEDFARMCNEDGSLKSQTKTTTFSLKDDPSKTITSITLDNNVLYGVGVLFVLVVAGAIVLFIRRHNKTKKK